MGGLSLAAQDNMNTLIMMNSNPTTDKSVRFMQLITFGVVGANNS